MYRFNTCSTACDWKGKGCKRLVIRRISLFDARYPKRDTAWHNIPYTSLLHPLGITVEKVSSCAWPLFPSKSATSIFVSSFYPRPVGKKWSAPPVLWEGMDSPSVANLVILKRCFAIRIGDLNCCVLSSCLCFFPCFLFCLYMFFDEPKQENAVSIGLTSPLSENIFSSFEFILIWKLCFFSILDVVLDVGLNYYPFIVLWFKCGDTNFCAGTSLLGGGFVNPENWSCLTSWTDPLDANLFHVMNLLFAQCKSFREIGSRISNPYMLNPRKHLSIW